MGNKSWHGFVAGQRVQTDQVVVAGERYIAAGKVILAKDKLADLAEIRACGHRVIVYTPRTAKGWGASPLNRNNWKTPRGDDIL